MNIELIAATLTDGYGLVCDTDNKVYLVKPPFTIYNKQHVDYEQVEEIKYRFGFTDLKEPYRSWDDVFKRLRNIAWEARKEAGDTDTTISDEDKRLFLSRFLKGFDKYSEKMNSFYQENRLSDVLFMGEALLLNPNLTDIALRNDIENVISRARKQIDNKHALIFSKFPHIDKDTNMERLKDFSEMLQLS